MAIHTQVNRLKNIGRVGAHPLNHIHTVVRTPNGNDYGKDLLRQHLEQYKHPHG